jgi:DNA polymerase III epsilon subunit-like protein
VDAVGWGTARLFAGTAASSPPAGNSLMRVVSASDAAPFQDTRDNAADFVTAIPAPSGARFGAVLILDESQTADPERKCHDFWLRNVGSEERSFTIDVRSEIGESGTARPAVLTLFPGECRRISIYPVPYEYWVVDLETTGVDPARHAIIEAAWVHVLEGEVVQSDSSLIFFEGELDPYVTLLTGITSEMLGAAPAMSTVIPRTLADLQGRSVLTFSTNQFDRRFLEAAAEHLGIDMPGIEWIDGYSWAKRAMPDLASHSLQAITEALGIDVQHHRALADALTTNLVFQEAVDRLGSPLYVEVRVEARSMPVGVLVLSVHHR